MFRAWVSAAVLGLAGAAAVSAGPARAGSVVILPGFTGSTECQSNQVIDDESGPCSLGGGKASFAPSPFALVQAQAVGTTNTPSNSGLAFLTYSYTIDGPAGATVTTDIIANLLAVTGDGSEIGFGSLTDTEGHQLCVALGQIGCGGVSRIDHGRLVETETTGVVYTLHLEVEASELNSGDSAFASVDPFIGIDQDLTIDPQLYSIRLSDGVANGLPAEGAPEPALWTVMLLGFAGLGTALRARRDRGPALA